MDGTQATICSNTEQSASPDISFQQTRRVAALRTLLTQPANAQALAQLSAVKRKEAQKQNIHYDFFKNNLFIFMLNTVFVCEKSFHLMPCCISFVSRSSYPRPVRSFFVLPTVPII
jgi:hypothetical protein